MSEKYKLQVVQVTPFQQNAMIFWSGESMNGVLIDPGGESRKLLAAIDELGVKIKQIWLTHGHIDHAGGAADCAEQLQCKIIGPHADDQYWLDQLEENAETYGISGARNFTPDAYLNEGDTVKLDELEFKVLHCPGHSPGSVVLFSEELSFAFMGDVLFQGSIGRTDLPGGDHHQLLNSITEKLWPLGKQISFMPGHGPGSVFGTERQSNGFVADSITLYEDEKVNT